MLKMLLDHNAIKDMYLDISALIEMGFNMREKYISYSYPHHPFVLSSTSTDWNEIQYARIQINLIGDWSETRQTRIRKIMNME